MTPESLMREVAHLALAGELDAFGSVSSFGPALDFRCGQKSGVSIVRKGADVESPGHALVTTQALLAAAGVCTMGDPVDAVQRLLEAARVWLPGADTSSADTARKPERVTSAADPAGTVRIWRLYL